MTLHKSLSHIRVMPDCHVGHGCCIGFTAHVDLLRVIPSYVGGDIGCGILTYPLKVSKLNLKRTEKIIKATIPMGGGHFNVHAEPPIELSFLERYLERAQCDAALFASKRGLATPPILDVFYFNEMCEKIGMDVSAALCAFGTLGAGNHFIETNQDPDSEEYFLSVHCGSRSFGMKLFQYHNKKVDATEKCLLGEDSLHYCYDLILAQQLAMMNRYIMLQLILRELDIDYREASIIESIHN